MTFFFNVGSLRNKHQRKQNKTKKEKKEKKRKESTYVTRKVYAPNT
jgi:hypothetical protein